MEQGITFVNIPMEIFSSKELTTAEKHLYGWLSIFKKQCCYQSNESLAEQTGLSERTISRSLEKLASMQYIFIEFVNGNNAKRRIYTLFDNPKKLAYLARKGMFSTGRTETEVRYAKMARVSRQNGEMSSQNGETRNSSESRQNGDHIIIKDNKKKGDLDEQERVEKIYRRNTIRLGAI